MPITVNCTSGAWTVPGSFGRNCWTFTPSFTREKNKASEGELSFFTLSVVFPGPKLNFAQNLLAHGHNQRVAMTTCHESGRRQQLTYGELKVAAARLQGQLLQVMGEGDVLACYMPNIAETVVAMLATSGIGGIFTSTSCDFGVQGVVDRFGQTEPKVLLTVSGYSYNGKYFDLSSRVCEIVERIPSIRQVIVVDFLEKGPTGHIPRSVNYARVMERGEQTPALLFLRDFFRPPLYPLLFRHHWQAQVHRPTAWGELYSSTLRS